MSFENFSKRNITLEINEELVNARIPFSLNLVEENIAFRLE